MACLERRRDEVRALAQVLSGADREVVSKAVQASMGLTSVDQCKDVVSLTAVQPEPTDAASATEIGAIRRELATVAASTEAGKSSAARLEVEPLIGRARRIGYSPLLAEVLLASVSAKGASGAAREVILAEGAEAVFEADRGRAESTRAVAATRLMEWATEAGRYDESERWSRIAEAALERSGDEGKRKAAWLAAVALLAYQRGHYEEYADKAQEALDIARRAGTGGAQVSSIEEILANAQAVLGHQEEAERLALEADDIVARSLGEDHPARIQSLSALSFVIGQVNDYRKALGYELKAVALAERVQPDHGRLPLIYNNTCWDLLKLGDRAGALHYCQEAVDRGLPIYGPDSVDLAYAYTSLGDVLFELHRYDEAIESGQKALAIYDKNPSALDTNCVHVFTGVGQAQILVGRAREGLASLERAVALSAKVAATSGEGKGFVADAHFALAKALWQAGVRTTRVGDLARAAEQMYERASNLDGAHEVQTWMADHRLG
jgi:tetratricopeptide (TPR) repeat protein